MSTTTDSNWLEEIGKPAFESIREMVAALNVDWQRLEELKEQRADWNSAIEDGLDDAREWAEANPDDAAELTELQAEAGDCEDEEDARERIQEDALSVQVRSDWHDIGEESEPAEFMILLSTGGPAVRIVGDLDRNEPSRPRLEVQDWFKPWTEYVLDRHGEEVLQAYCECFYFGE